MTADADSSVLHHVACGRAATCSGPTTSVDQGGTDGNHLGLTDARRRLAVIITVGFKALEIELVEEGFPDRSARAPVPPSETNTTNAPSHARPTT